jgi:hypothetical protein
VILVLKSFEIMANPNLKAGPGRPKGLKNKVSKDMKQRVLEAAERLDRENKSLADEALKDPKWFWDVFGKAMLPKDVNIFAELTTREPLKIQFIRPGDKLATDSDS